MSATLSHVGPHFVNGGFLFAQAPLRITFPWASDRCHDPADQADEVRGRELHLEATAAGRQENRGLREDAIVEDRREAPAATERADPADDVTRGALGRVRLGEVRPASTHGRGQALQVQGPAHRQDCQHRLPVDRRDKGLADPIRRDAECRCRLGAVGRPFGTGSAAPLRRLVFVKNVRDA